MRAGQVWIRSRSTSVTSSSAPPRRGGGKLAARSLGAAACLAAALAISPGVSEAKVFMTQEEALAAAFGPSSAPGKKTAYLSDQQAATIRDLSGSAPGSRIVVYYTGGPDPNAPLYAYFDSHVVRTFNETIQVVVGASGKTVRVDILSFDEPEDYLPKRRWLDQFEGRLLGDDLSLNGAIRPVTGATLSSRAITDAVRRVLATHAVLTAPAPPPAGSRP